MKMNNEILEYLMPITEEERAILEGDDIDHRRYMEDGSHVINAKKLLSDGKQIALRPHTRFVHFPSHTHDYVEMIYMCRGKTKHIVNRQKVILNAGEVLILNQHAHQEILPASEGDVAVNFIILPEFFDKALEMMGEEETPLRRFIIDCIAGRESTEGFLHFRTGDILPIQNLFENLIYAFIHNSPNKRRSTEFTMGLLLIYLINNSDRLSDEGGDHRAVARVLRYIEDNYRDGSLEDVAEQLHCDYFWLSREIKRRTGKNYTELLQEKRLSQAAFLLTNAKMKVADAAFAVGYSNMSYFNRIFEEHFGMTPRKYRINKEK